MFDKSDFPSGVSERLQISFQLVICFIESGFFA